MDLAKLAAERRRSRNDHAAAATVPGEEQSVVPSASATAPGEEQALVPSASAA